MKQQSVRQWFELVSLIVTIGVLMHAIGDLAYIAGGISGLAILGIVLLAGKLLIDKYR